MSLTVFGNKFSTCTQRILFTAAEIGCTSELEFHAVDLMKGQHKSPEHMKRQPFGKVPAAEIDGVPFFESRAISRILAESKGSTLIPRDLKAKAQFEQWASLESNTFAPAIDPILMETVFKPMRGLPTDAAVVKSSRADAQKVFEVFNEQLGKHSYIAGDELTLVDIFQTPNFQHLQNTEVGKEILASFPNIAAWWQRVSARPAWKSVLADMSKP